MYKCPHCPGVAFSNVVMEPIQEYVNSATYTERIECSSCRNVLLEHNYTTLIRDSMTLAKQIEELEKRAAKQQEELSKLKGVLAVNFTRYEGCPESTRHRFLDFEKEFKDLSTFDATMKVMEYFINEIKRLENG